MKRTRLFRWLSGMVLPVSMLLLSCSGGTESVTPHGTLRAIREVREQGDLATAQQLYKQAVTDDYGDMSSDSVSSLVSEALVQVYNTSLYLGNTREMLEWIDSVRIHPTPFIREHLMRDVYVMRGMMLSRTGREAEAREMVLSALRMPAHNASHQRLMRDYSYAASVCEGEAQLRDSVERWWRRSIDEAAACGNPPGTSYMQSALGDLYRQSGRIDRALDLLDSALVQAREREPGQAEINVLNQLAALYTYLGFENEADAFATEATELLGKMSHVHPTIAVETYNQKAYTTLSREPDSCAYWLGKAERAAHGISYNMGLEDTDLLRGIYYSQTVDSTGKALECLRRVAQEGSDLKRPEAWYRIAQIYEREGKDDSLRISLHRMTESVRRMPSVRLPEGAWPIAISCFLRMGDREGAIEATRLMMEHRGPESEAAYRHSLIDGAVEFHLYKVSQEMENSQLQATTRLYQWMVAALCLLAIVLGYGLWTFWAKRRAEQQNASLQKALETEKAQKRENTRQYERMLQALSHDVKEVLKRDEIMRMEEGRLHQIFDHAYPDFRQTLERKGIIMSRREKTLSILLIIGFDSSGVAEYLHITKQSVNIARYRLRGRLGLERGDDLGAVLYGMALPPEDESPSNHNASVNRENDSSDIISVRGGEE